MVDLVQLQLHSPLNGHRHVCLPSIRPRRHFDRRARARAPPARSQESSCLSHGHAMTCPVGGHALQPKHSSRRRPSALVQRADRVSVGRNAAAPISKANEPVNHVGSLNSGLLRVSPATSVPTFGPLPPASRVAHRQLQIWHMFTPYEAFAPLYDEVSKVFHPIVPSSPLARAPG